MPKHKADRKTVRFVRLMTGFDVGSWLGEILQYLSISVDMKIRIGFSFIGVQMIKHHIPKYTYFWAAPDLCEIEGKFYYPDDAAKFAEDLKGVKEPQYLTQTFLKSQSGKIFDTSGIGPHVLIACYIWITK